MAELYEKPKLYANAPSGVEPISGDPDLDKVLSELPPEEREEVMRRITAPPSGEEIANAMQEKNANGELFNMNLEQYRLLKAHNKNKEVDIISTFGQAASGIYDELMKAAGSVVDKPTDALSKLTPSLIEAFSQGTRSLYGMAAQSVDPTSVMFRMKNALSANGSDEEAEYSQFMEAQRFNVHSMNLMSGKETLIMDKDVINHEMTQVMSYVADPTLFIPFGGIAMKGARLVGMGEGLAKASARASMIRNKVLGGTLKWGVGAPIEFLGNATRNTIDYGLERSASAFEFATGMPAAEAQATARMYGLNSVAGSLAGQTVPLPIVGNVTGALVGATTAQGIGEAVSMLGEQMIKQQKNGRGVLSYAGQAIRDSEKAGIKMSAHAKGLLRVIDMADPLFVYGMDIAEGAGTGMVIGGGLGYLSGGEEGMASGAGAGFALGAVGAGLGSVTADITNNRLYDRVAIQRKMVIEGLKGTDDIKATALEAYVASAEATGDRRYMAEVDGMIAGIDLMSPNSKWNIRTEVEHKAWLESLKIDPKTGRLKETTAILPQFGADRKSRASALSFLSMVSDNFSGLPENLLQHIDTLPADHAMKKHWGRLGDDVKKAILAEVKQSGDIEYRKAFGGKKSNQYYGDINYAEAHTARINSLFDSGNPTQARERINMLIKEETVGGKLTERGKALKDKLATEGYFDKDGKMRPSRLKDVEATEDMYRSAAGFVLRRDSTGQVEVNLNLDQMGKVTGLHELFHAIMLDSPMKDEFVDRLSTKLLGKFDANGKRIEGASVDTVQVKKFFQRYIDSLHRNNPEERANETTRLNRAVEEYEQRGDKNKVNRTTDTTLEELVEEFGAFYFPKFIQDKPVDYLFRGGELGAMREMFQSVKFGWLDFWRSKIGSGNPDLNFDAVQGNKLSQAFGKEGGNRYKNKALDLFMGDFVRATAMANRNGEFDLSRLSNEGQKTFIRNNGIRGYGTIDKEGKVNRLNRRTALREEMRVGKEIYKIVAGIDPKYRQSLTIDGEGNFSGRISPELAEELVKSGHVDRAWVDKLLRAYDIVDGKGSNVIEFGYLGRTAQIGDYAWPRLVGSDVPFKNRKAILLDVDFKIGKDGRMTALYHTLDHAVIEGRANTLWSDPAVRQLWDGDRGSMEADFFRYLSNASLPSDHPNRVSSAKLLEDGTGKGAMRRNALHQMLGMAKLDGDVYINKPIAEIPLGIRHSVTTFNVDGVSGLRVRDGARYDYNHQNAFRDLSRNFMMSEMASEETPNGKILKHGTGYKITKMAGSNRFSVFDVDGKELGRFDTLADAGRAAQKDYNARFDAKVEGKDLPVPRTEVPPSRQAYIDREFGGITDNIAGGKEKFLENLVILVDRITATGDILIGKENRDLGLKIKKSIEEKGNVTLSELKEIQRIESVNRVHDTSRLPYYNYDYFLEMIDTVLSRNIDRLGQQYDNMYPMEIKSALHGRLAQIMQDYPNLTAQGLLKKLDVYGSQGYRYLQEAKEIGLVDLLKSKIKPKTEIYRKMDAQGNFTGEVATRELPVLFREIKVDVKDAEGNILTDKNGYPIKETRQTNENIQGTQPVLDMQEILDFAKSKEIKVTIEEGAREVNRMNTEQLTLGGDKSNYKETAIRINPEYAHGIRGHYGENTIVHFRTTERLDAEGNKVLFIEEVQANNPYTEKPEPSPVLLNYERRVRELESAKKLRDELLSRGLFVLDSDGTYKTSKDLLVNDFDYRKKILKAISDVTGSSNRDTHNADIIIFNEIQEAVSTTALNYSRDGIVGRLDDVFSDEDTFDLWSKLKNNKDVLAWIDASAEINKRMSEFRSEMRDDYSVSGLEFSQVEYPENLISVIADRESRLAQSHKPSEMKKPSFPLTEAKDWTLTALKGIIRQAIRDGLDTITLTHPDDSPTVSHMKEKARRGLYGKTIPEVWGSWLRKYGIEIVQQNKLRNASLETYRKNLVEVQNKIPDANEAVMDRFQQVMSGESSQNIIDLSGLLATPVHEITDTHLVRMVDRAQQINDVELRNRVNDLIRLKGTELKNYNAIETVRAEGVKGYSDADRNNLGYSIYAPSNISAEAIDRGMTFKLNDAIKQDFLSGNVKTHAMPTEGGMKGGRTYTPEQMKGTFIGRYADDNDRLVRNLDVDYELFSSGDQGRLLIKKLDGTEISAVTFDIVGKEAIVSFSSVSGKYQGKGIGNLAYSELIERFRSMGIEEVTGMIIDDKDRPLKIRRRIIDQENARVGGRPTDITGTRYDQDGSKQMDVTSYLEQKAYYQPAEGGRTYTAKQMGNHFIGRQAYERTDLTDGIRLSYRGWDKMDGKDEGRKVIMLTRSADGAEIGRIDFDYDHLTKHGLKSRGFGENENGGIIIDGINVKVSKQFQGKGYQHILYSEMFERARALGAVGFSQSIENKQGLPLKSINRVIGEADNFIASLTEPNAQRPTQENFDRLMAGAPSPTGNWMSNEPAVQNWGNINPKAKYMMAEERNVNYSSNDERVNYLMSVIDSVPHYKKAFDSGQLSIDSYNPEAFKDFQILSHAPDTASTVEQKNFNAQGGVGYPLLFPEEGWAAVSRGLEKRLNAIGEANFKKHGKWIAPMALVLSHAEKMKGARNGTSGFMSIIKQLEGKKVIDKETLRVSLIHGLKSIGTEIGDDAMLANAMFKTYKMLENSTSSGFKQRAKFVGNVAGSIARNTGNLTGRQIKALKEIIPTYTGEKTITKKELIPAIFKMFEDPLVKGLEAPDKKTGGDVYAFVLFDKPLVESESSPHASYKYSVRQEDNAPVRVDLLSRPMKTLEMFKEKVTSKGTSELKAKTVVNDTGQRNFPYGRVVHAQPAEGWRDWQSERTSVGSVIKNTAGYLIMVQRGKFKVYNPAKAIIGIYDNEEQAKRRVQKDEPRG